MAYKRKTRDIYEVQGCYCGEWECVTTEETKAEAWQMLKCYNKNEPQYQHRIKKKRERIDGSESV